jgi:nucleoside-diphosphate kinase
MPEEEKPVAISDIPIQIGRTLAIIKPDAIDKRDEIEEIILQHGFSILQVRYPVSGQCLF